MEKQSIYLGWRYYRDINTEDVIRQLVYISNDFDTMVNTLDKEFSLNGAEFVELYENSELKSESFQNYLMSNTKLLCIGKQYETKYNKA